MSHSLETDLSLWISLDNAHVGQTRLILLDAPMILFMALAFYSYIRFYKLRYSCATATLFCAILIRMI